VAQFKRRLWNSLHRIRTAYYKGNIYQLQFGAGTGRQCYKFLWIVMSKGVKPHNNNTELGYRMTAHRCIMPMCCIWSP